MRLLALILLVITSMAAYADSIPRECLKYRRDLVRISREVWGIDAPIATLAAQMRQESGCNPNAKSAYAHGLTQFTPDTADWIGGMFPDLADRDPANPIWALRAMATYDEYLFSRANGESKCDSMWFALWGYNGGPGWVSRDKKLAKANGANPRRHEQVAPFNAGRAPAMFKENRGYPVAIILRWQPLFIDAGWGQGSCT